jgi:alkaline phosphatase D
MRFKIQLLLLITLFASCKNKNNGPSIFKIAFGSCSDQKLEPQLWDEIAAQNPDLFIWMGDIVYADHLPLSKMKDAYKQQKNHPAYQKLMKSSKIIGIWDDHDYGANDGGKFHSKKDSSKLLLLDFLDVTKDNPIRTHTGVYSSHEFGSIDKKVKIIMLDTRYFRDTLLTDTISSARYFPNNEGDILGEQQWKWLENELTNSTAQLNIIVSGIQIIAKEHDFEKWSNFPKSKAMLLDMISKIKPTNLIFLSGDRHIAEVSKISINDMPYPIYDLTSSGLTHTWSKIWVEHNQYRVGELVIKKNYGLISIDWSNDKPQLLFEVKGHGDSTFLKQNINF